MYYNYDTYEENVVAFSKIYRKKHRQAILRVYDIKLLFAPHYCNMFATPTLTINAFKTGFRYRN